MLISRIAKLIVNIVCLVVIGAIGFCWLEDWSLGDSIYMTVITISTVGYGEMGELSQTGRAFTSGLIVLSIICMACWTANVTSVIVEGDITGVFREKRMQRMAKKLKKHIIICGSGTFAQSVIDLLYGGKNALVVVSDQFEETSLIRKKYPDMVVIEASPSDDLTLAHANLAFAEYVVVATPCDTENLLISMSCKQLNQELFVCSYCVDGKLAGRMNKLGVNEVICPHLLGSTRVVELMEKNEKRKFPAPLLAESLPYIGYPV